MPTRERLNDFIATIQRHEFLESIPEFYAENITARENQDPPRIGRDAQIASETAALSRMRFHRIRAVSYVLDGDNVAIHWDWGMTLKDGTEIAMEEIAYQTWEGDRIVAERYFYDPSQRAPRPKAP